MRVPSSLHLANVADTVGRLQSERAKQTEALGSGRRINRASDDPGGAARASKLRSELQSLDAQSTAATYAHAQLTTADSSLEQMGDLFDESIHLATQGANELLTPDQRSAVAAGIRALADSLLQEGNRRQGGRALFAGAQTATTPFTRAGDGSFVYAGDSTVRQLDIDGVTHALNAPGDAFLTSPNNAGEVLERLAQAVETGAVANAATALQDLEGVRQQVIAARVDLGLSAAQLERTEANIDARKLQLTDSLSEVEDADLVDVAAEMSRLDVYIEANLRAAAKSSSTPSLFSVLA